MTKRNQFLEAVNQLKAAGMSYAIFTNETPLFKDNTVMVDHTDFMEMFPEGNWKLYAGGAKVEDIIYTHVCVKVEGLTVIACLNSEELADAKSKGLLKEAE